MLAWAFTVYACNQIAPAATKQQRSGSNKRKPALLLATSEAVAQVEALLRDMSEDDFEAIVEGTPGLEAKREQCLSDIPLALEAIGIKVAKGGEQEEKKQLAARMAVAWGAGRR